MANRKCDHSQGEEKLRQELDRVQEELDLTRKTYEMEMGQLTLVNRTLMAEKTRLEREFEVQRCDNERKLRQLIFELNQAQRQHADQMKDLKKDFETTQTGILTELVILRQELAEASKLNSEKDEQIEALKTKMSDCAELVALRQELEETAKLNTKKDDEIEALIKNMSTFENIKMEVSKLNLIMEQKDVQMELLLRRVEAGLSQRKEIEQQAEAVQKLELEPKAVKEPEAGQQLETTKEPEAAQQPVTGMETPSQRRGEVQARPTSSGAFFRLAGAGRQGYGHGQGYKPFRCDRCGRRYYTAYHKDLHQEKCEPQQDHSNNKKNPEWKLFWYRKYGN